MIVLDATDMAAVRATERRWHEKAGRDPVGLMAWQHANRQPVTSEARDDGTLVEWMDDGGVRCTGALR